MIDALRSHPGHRVALVEGAVREETRYGALVDAAHAWGEALRRAAQGRALVFLAMGADADAVRLYLGCLDARLPVCLCEPHRESIARLAAVYQPQLVLLPPGLDPGPSWREDDSPAPRYRMWRRAADPSIALHADLALLLPTSGSTGNPKLVRLTAANLESNARAIAQYLELTAEERAAGSLPLHYSYGLSVLHSHLVSGGSILLTAHSFLRREFWAEAEAAGCTSFAGVPYMYETLHRLRLSPARPGMRTLTQAGGRLRPELVAHVHQQAAAAGARFFVMYGQTEATARISYVPPADLPRKPGSIGVPIPGGALRVDPGEAVDGSGELVYSGPNVMMGYAEGPEDLALGDVQHGVLRTGDLGRVDEEGFFTLVGRLRRFAKLFGRRVNLEDVEREVERAFPALSVAALDGGDRIVLHCEGESAPDADAVAAHVARLLAVPPPAIVLRPLPRLPRTPSGKKDYRALETLG